MKFPVDVLAAVSHSELEQRAQSYMRELLYSNPECPEQLTLPDSTKVDISISSVGLVPLYGSCDTQKVLALFAPADPFTPVALYLLDQWWAVGDLLHTADNSRDGLVQVDTLGERIVLYVLNRIVYRVQEMSSDELPFLCHGEQDFAKILWKNGQAVGFYSVKPTGSPCSSFSSRTYPLSVMDSVFVRKCHRGKGLGLHMLEDFVDSFKEDHLGLRYPLTTAMYKVCQCYLRAFPRDSELLWEVDSSRFSQRTSISSRIHSMNLRGASRTVTCSESAVSGSVHHTEENVEEITIVKTAKGTGPGRQKNTDEQCSTDIRISEEVTMLRLVQNTEVAQTEELLEVTTENGRSIVFTELDEDTMFDKVTALSRSQEDSKVTQNLNILCSSAITVENVASEIEECLHSQEDHTVESSNKTATPEGTVSIQRVLRTRTVVNIPQPLNLGDVDGDVEKSVDEFGITQELKHEENVTAEIQTKNTMEETQVLHRMPLRGSIATPKPTRASMRLNQVQRSTVEAGTQKHGRDTEEHESQETEDTVEFTGGNVCLAAEVTNEAEKQEATDIVALDKAASEELSKGCVVPEIPPEAEDNDDAESETFQKVLQLGPSQTEDLEEAPEEVSDTAAVTEEALCVTTMEHESLSPTQGETEVVEVVQTRTLRSGARANSSVETPRTTRSRQQKVKEEIVQTQTIKRGKKSTGKKQVSKLKGQTQEFEASSAEEDITDQMSLPAEVSEDWANNNEPVNHSESQVAKKTQDTVSKEDNKDQEPALVEDNEEEVKGEIDITEEETAVVEHSSAEAVEEEKTEEASSSAEVEPVLPSITEPEDTQQTEGTMETDKESQPVMELNLEESGIDKELEEESVPKQSDETTPIVETRSLRSGPKTVTATPRHSHTEENQTAQPATPDRLQEEPQNEQDTTEEQSKECVAPEIPSEVVDNDNAQFETKTTEVVDNDHAQFETKIAAEVVLLVPSQTKDTEETPDKCPEDVSGAAEAPHVVTTEHENLSSSETKKVIETRALRSGVRPISTVLTPRTTRSSKRKLEEEIVEKTTLKRGKKSIGRSRVSRSKVQTQELEASSAEEDITEEVQTETSELTTIENNDMSLSTEVDEDGTGKDIPIKDLEPTVSNEDNKDQAPALIEENTLHKEDEEVKNETDITETAVVDSSSAEAVDEEKTEETSSTAEGESVLLSTIEPEDTQQIENTMEIDKESHPEALAELNTEESGIDKEPEQESVPEQSEETTPIVETRSLRSGPKTVTATPRCIYKEENHTVQPEMPDRPQEEPQNEQDSSEEQSKECVASEIPSDVVDNDDAQSETKIAAELVQLIPCQTKDPEETPEECPEGSAAVAFEEAPPVVTAEHENLSFNETEKVIETRALRSGAKPISPVLTPRTTRTSSKQKVEEEIEKPTTKQGQKSTGRKRASRSKAQTHEPGPSSAEDSMTKKVQTETPGHTAIENNDMSLSTEVGEDGAGKNKTIEDLETTVSNEDSKDQEPVLVEEDTLHKDNEEISGETDSTEAVDQEKTQKASSAAEVESVLLSTIGAENTQQTESTMETDKDSQAVMELNTEESGIDKELEEESVPEQTDETTPIPETRSLRSGPKTVTVTPRHRHTGENETVQPETPVRPQEEPQNEQDSSEKQSKECVTPEIPSEVVDNDDTQSETKIATEVVQLVPSQTKDPEECLEEVSGAAEAPPVVTAEHENLSSSETEKVVETRALRSGARPISTILTPRTTRSSKQKVEEHIVEKTTNKRGKKSTGRRRESRYKAETQEPEPFSAEDSITEEIQTETSGHTAIENNDMSLSTEVGEDGAGKDKTIEDLETTVSNEDSKDPQPELVEEDALNKDNEEVKGETDITEDGTAIVEHSSAEAVEEKKTEEASSAAEVESSLQSTTEAEDTQQTESTMETDKESQPEAEMELNIEDSGIDKEPEQESVPGQSDETTPIVETSQPETQDKPQEEPQNEKDSTEEQSNELLEIPSEVVDSDDAQPETKIATELVQLIPSQTKDTEETPDKCPENVSSAAEAPHVVTPEHINLSSSVPEKVIETRALRSGARPISTVLTPRTTRSSKRKVEEEIVEKTAIKRGKKSTGRKRLSRSKAQSEEPEPSSAGDNITEEFQTETPGQTAIENNDMSLSTEVGEDGTGKDKTIEDFETTVSNEDSKDQRSTLVEEDTLHKGNEEVKGDTDITEEEAVVVEHSSAEAVDEEKTQKASSAAELESVLLSTTEAEDTQQIESNMEMDKESQSEAEMELNIEESGIDKHPEQESVPGQSEETTPIVETRSLRSGSKTVTATPRCIYKEENQTGRPQEEPQNEKDSTEEQSKEQSEIPSDLIDNDDAQSETMITAEVVQLIPSQTIHPEEIPEKCPEDVSGDAEAPAVVRSEHESLTFSETEKVIETRALRSGARLISTILTPRTTRSSKRKIEEEIVEKTTNKRGKNLTGRKRLSRSKAQIQESEPSSAEDNMTEEVQTETPGHTAIENNNKSLSAEVDEDGAGKDETIEDLETTVSKDDSKDHEHALVEEDTLHKDNEEVKCEPNITEDDTAVVEHSSAEAVQEEKTEEASSAVEVESVLPSTTEEEDTQQTESTMEMDKESQPEVEMELNIEESGINKELEQESVPAQSNETTPIVETRSLRSGPKTVTATPRHIYTEENQTAQPEMLDRPQEEPQNEKDSTEEQSKEQSEISSEVINNDDAQSETMITAEVVQLIPSQTIHPEETPEKCPEDVSGDAEAPAVVRSEHESLTFSETEKVIETRALRSGARLISTILTPRTTRSSKRKIEEEIVEKTTNKRGKNLTGRKRLSRSKAQIQESEPSSAEDNMTEEVQTETPGHTAIENNNKSLSAEVDEDGAGKDETIEDLETTVSKDDSKDHEHALVEEDTLHKDNEEVKCEPNITEDDTAVVEHSSAEAVQEEKTEEASSAVEVESVLPSTTEEEDTQQTESTMEMDKESQPEVEMELNIEESGINKELEQESVPAQSNETTPIVETRSLRSGPKTVTATPRHIYTEENQTTQPEMLDRPQEEPQNEKDSTEEQSKEQSEIPSEVADKDNVQTETNITADVVQLIPSHNKDPEETLEKCPEEVSSAAEAPLVVTTEHVNLSSSETEKVIETRALRSGARPISTVLTPRTTRSRKQKVEEEIVEKTTIKQGKKSTGRKRLSRSKAQSEKPEPSSAEDNMTEEVNEDGTGKDKTSEDLEPTVSNEDSKDQQPTLIEEDTLHKEDEAVKGETDITEEETAVVEHSSAEAVQEEKTEEASSAVEVESVLPSTTEEEDTQQTESTMETEKESYPEGELELNVEDSGIDKELEQESVPEQSDETTTIVETRSLRSGLKTVTATPRLRHTEENQTTQPATPVKPQEEPQNEQDSTKEPSKECVTPEISSDVVDNDDTQSETKIAPEVVQLVPSQTKDHEECPEEVSGAAEAPPVVTAGHENLSSIETEKVIETRALRSGARPMSTVVTPRTTRSSKRKVEEEIVEKTTIKRGKKSTGRKRVSRSKVQTQETEPSSAGDSMTEEVQTETPGHTAIENNDMSLSTEVGEDGAGKDKTIEDLETTVSNEDSKDPQHELVEEDALNKDNREVKGETNITEDDTAVVEHSSADALEEEKTEEASSAVEVESVLPSMTEEEDTQQTESTMETDKESQPEAEMELNTEESGINKELEQESVPEQSDETTPIAETRSLRSGPKTVTATPRHTGGNQTTQPVTPDRPPNEQDFTESKERVAPEIPSEVVENDDAQFETKIISEVPLLDLPRVAVVLVDVQKVQAVKSFNETATSEQQDDMKDREDNCQTPIRSSRKRARVDYQDSVDLSESLTSEDVSKDTLNSRRFSSEPQSEEEESSEGIVLSLRLDEEEEQSASEEELVTITGKNLRSRSVPSIIISPHSKTTPLHSTVSTPKQSPEKTPQQTRRSAKASPGRTSKRLRK